MGKLRSFLKVEGTIGDVTFFKRDGEIVAREKGGVNGNIIKTDPRFERTRENMQEFGNITASSALIREGLSMLSRNAKDGRVHQRLTSILAQVKNMDSTSVRGARNVGVGIGTVGAINFFEGFDFNVKSTLSSVLSSPFTVNTLTGEIAMASLVPGAELSYPGGATHVRLTAGWLKVDFALGQRALELSAASTLPLNMSPVPVVLLPAGVPALPTGKSFYLLKIEFGQEINGIYYPLKNGEFNCLNVVKAV